MFRDLKADEIDVRIGSFKEGKGASLLLYKDARVDMDILDETVGAFNWKREHTRDNKNCVVSIWDKEKLQWISKEDTGSESNAEKEKGLASDSFKRACFNWGIGRELYTAPFIWAKNCGKYDKFKVKGIEIDNKKIVGIIIINNKGEQVYKFSSATNQVENKAPRRVNKQPEKLIQPNQLQRINILISELGIDTKVADQKEKIYKWLGITSLKVISEKQADVIINKLIAAKKIKKEGK